MPIGSCPIAISFSDTSGILAWDVAVAEVFTHDRTVLAFDQGIVIAAAGAGFGEFCDLEFVEQLGDAVVDVLRAVVGVEAAANKGKGQDEAFQDGKQEAFADALDGSDELKLGDLVDGVDEIQSFDAIQVALVDAVDAQIPRLSLCVVWACGARRC